MINKKVHILHIGKTGGTALKHALKKVQSPKFEIVFHNHKFKLMDVPEREKVVFFLRNPESRFLSAFYSRKRKGKPRYDSQWSKTEELLFNTYPNHQMFIDALRRREEAGMQLLKKSLEEIKHFWSITYWLESLDYLSKRKNDILFVGFQETLNKDFETLKEKLGLDKSIALPANDLDAHRGPGYDKSLNNVQKNFLVNLYAEDLNIIEFCKSNLNQ